MTEWVDAAIASSAMPVPGQTLADRFVLEHLACKGGMSAIYRGTDVRTGTRVAIKIVGSSSDGTRGRFVREGKLLAQLRHPRIVEYLAHGVTAAGLSYLVMEWLEGEDLSARLARERLGEEESLTLVRRVSEALAAAHRQGVVHRDIKPANLFLEGKDPEAVKVLDFGVARLLEGATATTTANSFIGTVGYMAPEQVMCEPDVDARADVFAVGCVLYECLTGRAPFASAHPVGVLAKVLREEPRGPSELLGSVDPRIDDFLRRLLAKRRDERPADAAAVLVELDALRERTLEARRYAELRRSIEPPTEQRVVSVILGRSSLPSPQAARDANERTLQTLSSKFEVEIAPLAGGGLLLVLTGRGQASDRACRAASCALELSRLRPDLTLAIATGLADTSGEVPVGAAIDRAAELLRRDADADPGISVDDVTPGLIGTRFKVSQSKGRTVLVGTHPRLDAPKILMGRPTPCIGRERELSMLDGVFEECLTDRVARAVVVTGSPGIGKSRLAGEWLGRIRHRDDVRTLVTFSDPGSGAEAYALMQQLVRHAAGLRAADPAHVQLTRLRQHLAAGAAGIAREHVEFLAEMLGLQEQDGPDPILRAARANPEIMRERIRLGLHAWLDVETARQPVVVVLDDLHWGDAPSVALLTDALREKPNRPFMVLGLARPQVEQQFPRLGQLATLRIRVQGLTARAAEQLVKAVLRETVEQDVLTRVIQTADGNPFYLEELLRRVATGSKDWPDTVLAMAQSRIEELDFCSRWALRAASVFGERTWDRGVQAVLGPDLDARELLGSLAREEFLVESLESRYSGSREYRFRHALLRDAAYAMMTEEDRRQSHGIAGEWLEQHGETHARILAEHYEAAGLAERACHWLVRASRAAIDAGDLATTTECADRGVSLGASGAERGRLLLARAYAEAQRGDPDLDAARGALDLLTLGSAPWWLALATLIFGSGMHGRPEAAAPYVALAQEAPFASERDTPFGQGLVTLVGGLVLLGEAEAADMIVERVARTTRTAAEPDPVFEAFLNSARCALTSVAPVHGEWQLERALLMGRSVIESFRELGAVHGESVALYYLAAAAIHLGLYEEARAACQRSVELIAHVASSINDGWPRLLWARALLRLGNADGALGVVSELDTSPNRIVRHMLPVVRGEAQLRKNNFAAAAAEARPACAGVSPRLRRLAACVLARAELALDRPEEALSTVELGLGKGTSQGLETDIDLLTLRAEALHAMGRTSEALEAILLAEHQVDSVATGIGDPALRASFLENVEPCVRARSLRARWASDAGSAPGADAR